MPDLQVHKEMQVRRELVGWQDNQGPRGAQGRYRFSGYVGDTGFSEYKETKEALGRKVFRVERACRRGGRCWSTRPERSRWRPRTTRSGRDCKGDQGVVGLAGAQGFAGEAGPAGAQGIVGPDGFQGEMDPQRNWNTRSTWNFWIAGDVGSQGNVGPDGSIGHRVIGKCRTAGPRWKHWIARLHRGRRCVQGAQGDSGFQGDTGAQGFQGAQA